MSQWLTPWGDRYLYRTTYGEKLYEETIGIWVRVQSYIGWRRKLYSFGLIPYSFAWIPI